MSYSSCSCFYLLDRTIHICVSCFRAVKMWVLWVQFSHTDHWMFNMAPHGKELSDKELSDSFNSTVALQGGFLKHLRDVATVLLDLVCLSLFWFFMSFQTDWMMIRSDLCVEHWLLSDSLCKKSHWIITINGQMNVWKCKLIFPTDTLQQKIERTDLKPFFSWWKYLCSNNFGHHCIYCLYVCYIVSILHT